MDEGLRINITFLLFDIDKSTSTGTCYHWLQIEDEKYCGEKGTSTEISTPFTIITNSNSVDVTFRSDNYDVSNAGFLAIWSQYNFPTGCNNCDFPFTIGDTTFETCISVQDVDTQPWCSYSITPPTPPVINTPPKITCSVSDSSCPSSTPQTVIISPRYPQSYSNNADQVK